MRSSQFLIPTLKETPAEAEIPSHQLMLRAGMIRKNAAGLYSWLPLGLKVLRKVEAVIREEMQNAGAQELLMPVVQPAELWEESGRWEQYGAELLRIQDRHGRAFCLGPTHEEVITDIVRNEVQSYKQLPLNLFQIQTKFRDEIRPRFGIMRAREFTMKDSYSFHLNDDCLQKTYASMYQAYQNIFSRLGLQYRAVEADTGSIGGSASHEFHVLADAGEDAIAFSDSSDFAANVELAESIVSADAENDVRAAKLADLEKVATGAAKTIADVCQSLDLRAEQTVKTLIVKGQPSAPSEENCYVALVIRGDHTLNEIKAEKLAAVEAPLNFASDEEIRRVLGCNPGAIGPVLEDTPKLTVVVDRYAANVANFCCGANEDGFHLMNVNWQRDIKNFEVADIRNVEQGDPSPDGNGKIVIRRGIEVGHIFQLGKKYSDALNATVLDESGQAALLTMGCYGIGVTRIIAACIEQNHDENGIRWPLAMSPFEVILIPLNAKKSDLVKQTSEQLYKQLQEHSIDVLLDDRNERPGVKFANAELIGIPHVIVLGEKSLLQGKIEYKRRDGSESCELSPDDLSNFLADKLNR